MSGEQGPTAAELLARTELFAPVGLAVLEEFSSELEVVHLHAGQPLMHLGEPGDCMYMIISGRLHVFVPTPEGGERIVASMGVGESVGEMALITDEPRSATVRAKRDSELVKITRSGFERFVSSHPAAMRSIARFVADRLRKVGSHARRGTAGATIAILPAGEGAPVADFAARLARSLAAHGELLHLDRERFEVIHGEGSSGYALGAGGGARRIASWLNEQETTNRFILFEADRSPSPWTARCIREADRLLLVADAASEPAASEVEAALLRPGGDAHPRLGTCELVLLHRDRDRLPAGTGRWLRGREVLRHHHLGVDDEADSARLARILAGQSVGLVLGGGGARGFAHIGVLRALAEAGIAVDMVCGVSMGAIVAAQAAMGWDVETMLRRNREGIAEAGLARDFTLPVLSLNSGRKFGRALRSFFGDADIEDLWRSFFCVSCNLTKARTVVHRRGRLWRAVNASNAAPGLLPPVLDGGDLLVDGGVVNNQPGDLMAEECSGPVIVVNVSPRQELAVDPSLEQLPSAWSLLWRRLSPFHASPNAPTIGAVMMRALLVGSYRKSLEVEAMTDYYLRPPLTAFKMDDYARIEEIAETGYRHAAERIAGWTGLPRG